MIRAVLHGRLGADPVTRMTRNGNAMVTASVAADVGRPGDEPETEWINLVGFCSVGELLARHGKGDPVTIMGGMSRSTFTGRDGETRTSWGITVEAILSVRTARPQAPPKTPVGMGTRRRRGHRSAIPATAELPSDPVDDLWRS
jgi:single-strand DNA-binding protein